jgi:hypothetical protein
LILFELQALKVKKMPIKDKPRKNFIFNRLYSYNEYRH